MSLQDLRAVLAPPPRPRETGDGSWPAVEQRLGTALPPDYKGFIETYGTGRVGDFLVVLNPFSANRFIDLVDHALNDPEGRADLLRQQAVHDPFERYPAPGGLMPFAVTDNGDIFYWLTSGSPEGWSVVLAEGRGPDHEVLDGPMTALIAGLLARRVRSGILPQSFPAPRPTFIPV